MLFNSYEFLFLFFPIVLMGYFALGKREDSNAANLWLVAASLFFYSYWNIRYLPLLLASIAFNYISMTSLSRLFGTRKYGLGFFIRQLCSMMQWRKTCDRLVGGREEYRI